MNKSAITKVGNAPVPLEKLSNVYHPLPKSWLEAAGMLRDKRKALEGHLKKIRSEWDNGA